MASSLDTLRDMFPQRQVISRQPELAAYEMDASLLNGQTPLVILAEGARDVQKALSHCYRYGIPFVGRGRATGYTGGCVPTQAAVVISLERWRGVESFNITAQQALVCPGTTIGELNTTTKAARLFFPPDPVSKEYCTIGGGVSENSSGPRCFMFGPMHQFVDHFEFFLPSGEITTVRKNGQGPYDEWFWSILGSEGTLGIVGRVACRLVALPPWASLVLLNFDDYSCISPLQQRLYASRLDFSAMEMVTPAYSPETGIVGRYFLYLENFVENEDELHSIQERIRTLVHDLPVRVNVNSGDLYVRRGEGYRDSRGRIVDALKQSCVSQLIDGVVPRVALQSVVHSVFAIAQEHQLPMLHTFHFSDGNIHPTFFYPVEAQAESKKRRVLEELMGLCLSHGGSLTGEHGIGLEKRSFVHKAHSVSEIEAFGHIKTIFDPNGLVNPGKVLPSSPAKSESIFPKSMNDDVKIDELQMIVTCSGATKWSDLKATVSDHGYEIPIEIPGLPSDISVQETVFSKQPNLHGLRYGETLDQLLSVQFDDMSTKSHIVLGRPLVKNVSGFCLFRRQVPLFSSWSATHLALRIVSPIRSKLFSIELDEINDDVIRAVTQYSPSYYVAIRFVQNRFIVTGRSLTTHSYTSQRISARVADFSYWESGHPMHNALVASRSLCLPQAIDESERASDLLIEGLIDVWFPQRSEGYSHGAT